MRKWWLLCALLVLWNVLGYALSRWHSPADLTDPKSDRTRRLRIVSVAPSLTELLYALDLDEAIVGVTLGSDYPPAATEIPKVGTFWQPSIEAVIACKPNLVVTLAFQQHRSLVTRLQRMGYKCLSTDIWKIADLFAATETVGRATAREAQAERLIAGITAKMRRLQETLRGRDRPRVLWVVQREPLRVAGCDTFINELIELAGGENAIGPTLHKYPPIGAEQVIAADIQVIIEPTMGKGDLDRQRDQAISYWRRLPNVPAVVAGRIHIIEGDIVSRLGPRLYQGIETIAQCLHPDVLGE